MYDLNEVAGRVDHSAVSQSPVLKVERRSGNAGAGVQHPLEGGVHVVAPQADMNGIALAGHVESIYVSRGGG